MVVGEASIHNIMGGIDSTAGVRLNNHKRKLKQRFDIIKKLGQGTYGKVQLGINKETGQEVAIKTIKKCKIETEADLIRIRREVQIMSSVQHPNIIHIYEVFENKEKMVLVMEYAAGGELYDYLSERKILLENEARRIFRQISTAVYYCHKHKICHRDLKLENILLDQMGNAKIADFGLSNVFDAKILLNTFCGSPLYASPEIVKGTPYYGPEVDCWSLGVLLYTLVYGAMPFDGSNFKRLVKQICESDYFEPKKPSPASSLIKDMLTVCPLQRANIDNICSHWWINEGYEQSCFEIAEDLAEQTPVRLDLLLSLVPESANADNLLVGNHQESLQLPSNTKVMDNLSSSALVPIRCHSVGDVMELDKSSNRKIKKIAEFENTSNIYNTKNEVEALPTHNEITKKFEGKKQIIEEKRTNSQDLALDSSFSTSRLAPNILLEERMEVDHQSGSSSPIKKNKPYLMKISDLSPKIKNTEEMSCENCHEDTAVAYPLQNTTLNSKSIDRIDNIETSIIPNDFNKGKNHQNVGELKNSKKFQEAYNNISKKSNKRDDNNKNNLTLIKSEEKDPVESQHSLTYLQQENNRSSDTINKPIKNVKKLKCKAYSLDYESSGSKSQTKTFSERRKSKIFETAEKFSQLSPSLEQEKPKIFIPGVNVGGAKLEFERKASLSTTALPLTLKVPVSRIIIDVPSTDKEVDNEKTLKKNTVEKKNYINYDVERKKAIDIITGALGKPPIKTKLNGAAPMASIDSKKPLSKEAVISCKSDSKTSVASKSQNTQAYSGTNSDSCIEKVELAPDSPCDEKLSTNGTKKCSQVEIMLKSATLPRSRKTTKAEITLLDTRPIELNPSSEVTARLDVIKPRQLKSQHSEMSVTMTPTLYQTHRSCSLDPESPVMSDILKERIIPIHIEQLLQPTVQSKRQPPQNMSPQHSPLQCTGSISRSLTADSNTSNLLGSTSGLESIRKVQKEYIIPIAVEGGRYLTPRSDSIEPECMNSLLTCTNPSKSRLRRVQRGGSFLSDASDDESPLTQIHRDNEDLLQRSMHQLRSTRPSRQLSEHADSLTSDEDDDDDGFELLTAENLFSTLLSRVRSLTQRLNIDNKRSSTFPSKRLLTRFNTNSPSGF